MRLETTIDLFCGGPGSGCHGPHCGRPHSYKEGTAIHKLFEMLKNGKWHDMSDLWDEIGYEKLNNRLYVLKKHGEQNGQWTVQINKSDMSVRMVLKGQKPKEDKPAKEQPKQEVLKGKAFDAYAKKVLKGLTVSKIGGDSWAETWDECHPNCNPAKMPVRAKLYAAAGLKPSDGRHFDEIVSAWTATSNDHFAKLAQKGLFKNGQKPMEKAMRIENMITQAILGKGTVTLYRGIDGDYANAAVNKALASDKDIQLKTRGSDSWTDSKFQAEDFGNVILKAEIPTKYIVASYKSNYDIKDMDEREFIVAFPGKKFTVSRKGGIQLTLDSAAAVVVDLTDEGNFQWLKKLRKRS